MKHFKTPPVICPWCGHVMDGCATMNEDSAGPSDGDWTLCIQCALPSIFVLAKGVPLNIRKPTSDEVKVMSRDVGFLTMGAAVIAGHMTLAKREK